MECFFYLFGVSHSSKKPAFTMAQEYSVNRLARLWISG